MKYQILSLLLSTGALHAADRIIISDFEGPGYGSWKVSGGAFGKAPANGTLRGQMEVTGFEGKGWVSSFTGGDATKGELTSPDFTIDRRYLTFLIGGGAWKDETAIHLLADGKIVRSATGRNYRSGGSEKLSAAYWDVSEFSGKRASITIIDHREGVWGHINVDQIVLIDDKRDIPPAINGVEIPEAITREAKVTGNFLQLPIIRNPDRSLPGLEKLTISSGGKVARALHLMIPAKDQKPDFWYSLDLREFKGKEVSIGYASNDPHSLDRLEFSDKNLIDPSAYDGPHRPQFHFSPRLGWMNDINGIYYQDGIYHLFYQYNPVATGYGAGFDMHWGHSVSKDLMHWEEWPVALFPDAAGQCYSGTAVMQQHPVGGLNEGLPLPAPVIFFTGTEPFSQHIATTPDSGQTWKRFPGNPVVPKFGRSDRDPKVIWHEPSQHYVMVLYVDAQGHSFRFLRSKDLTHWEVTSEIPGWYECPEFFPVTSPSTGEELMLLYGCFDGTPPGSDKPVRLNSCYQLGRFDGKTFTPISEIRPAHQGPNFYAALVFMNEPKGRTVMMGWGQNTRFPGEPFNQCASLPLELKLKAINGEDKLCYEPAVEVESLRGAPILTKKNLTVAQANKELAGLTKEAPLDVLVKFHHDSATTAGVRVRGIHFLYDAVSKTISRNGSKAALHPDESLDARILIDRGIVEAFWNGGEAAYAISSLHTDDGPALLMEGEAEIEELTVYPMSRIWKEK